MNYELAKELKEAGFPGNQSWIFYNEGTPRQIFISESGPSLPELIEACGLKNMLLMKSGKLWQAFDDDNTFCTNQGKGPAPEEAVARLWLALNKR